MREFSEQELVRREKLDFLRERGLDPFGHRFDVDKEKLDLCIFKISMDKFKFTYVKM